MTKYQPNQPRVDRRRFMRSDLAVPLPVAVEKPATSCNCQGSSGIEAKIKENPLVFVLGAALLGYLLAKN